ncbi:MAG: ADP-dependent glucokinase/phosphofructokinase [Candidatus Aenigmatarchaeota archaeon]
MLYRNSIKLPDARVATGMFSNLDSVIKVDNNSLKFFECSRQEVSKTAILSSLGEVACALKASKKSGDAEYLISKGLYDTLITMFPMREVSTGGNGNNMGKALLELGIVPLVSYPCRSERLMKSSENFKVACGKKFKSPIESIRDHDQDYEHIIFESESWRRIFTWDVVTSKGIFDEDFLRFAFDSKFTDIAIISYAHLMLPEFKKRTDHVLEKINKERPKVHLEFGLGSMESMKYAMERFSEEGACDSWGMNGNEGMLYLNAASNSRKDLVEASLAALKEFNLSRICVHSSKFAFSVSKNDAKKELDALTAGCLAAAMKASKKLKISKVAPIKKTIEGYTFCLVPTFYNPYPEKLTGLGDIFACVQAVKALC